ncbi:MAG: hypothetical protein ACTSPB_25985 [Candidatus Thorarchaeota archaeon]
MAAPLNPYGAVAVFDGENPRTFTAKARVDISGGALVVVSGAANAVGSHADSFKTSDIVVDLQSSTLDFCNGIALTNAGSNSNVAVATRGAYLVRAASVISGGQEVIPYSGTIGGVQANPCGTYATGLISGTTIGRCLIPSASGTNNYALVDFNF